MFLEEPGFAVFQRKAGRVPWLMRVPQLGRRRHVLPGRFSHIDLMPTILDLMGQKPMDDLPGRSLSPVIRGAESQMKDVFIQWNPRVKIDKQDGVLVKMDLNEDHTKFGGHFRTVISQDGWKFSWADDDKNQLFNMKEDPYETTNLCDSGRYEDVISRWKKKIMEWQLETKDGVVIS